MIQTVMKKFVSFEHFLRFLIWGKGVNFLRKKVFFVFLDDLNSYEEFFLVLSTFDHFKSRGSQYLDFFMMIQNFFCVLTTFDYFDLVGLVFTYPISYIGY